MKARTRTWLGLRAGVPLAATWPPGCRELSPMGHGAWPSPTASRAACPYLGHQQNRVRAPSKTQPSAASFYR